jgi:2-succinyl-6-hydroxy-2,4-cyclohexadiene-1-carboxylate synthase
MRNPLTLCANLKGDPGRPAVVFLHGFMGAGNAWDEVAAALEPDFTCITVDLPGHGQSPIAGPPAMDAAIEAVAEAVQCSGIDRYALVGYSMGGRVALSLARRFPERVGRLVLESASPGLVTANECAVRRVSDERLAQKLESDDFAAFLDRWYGMPMFSSLRTHGKRFEALVARRLRNDPRKLATALRGLSVGNQPSLWEDLRRMDLPMLLIAGQEDAKYCRIVRQMADRCPSATVEAVPRCGHNVHFEDPGGFVARVRRFLGLG